MQLYTWEQSRFSSNHLILSMGHILGLHNRSILSCVCSTWRYHELLFFMLSWYQVCVKCLQVAVNPRHLNRCQDRIASNYCQNSLLQKTDGFWCVSHGFLFFFCKFSSPPVFDLRCVWVPSWKGAEKDARSTFGACSSEDASVRAWGLSVPFAKDARENWRWKTWHVES